MKLIDADILVDVLRGGSPAVNWLQSVEPAPMIPGLAMLELIQGCANQSQTDHARSMFELFALAWPSDGDCDSALDAFPRLHLRDGTGLIDVLIAYTALGLDAELCTFNVKHFRNVPGLRIEQPYKRE